MWLTDVPAEAVLTSADDAMPDSVNTAVKTAAAAALLAWDFFIPDLPFRAATPGGRRVLAQSPGTNDPLFISKHRGLACDKQRFSRDLF